MNFDIFQKSIPEECLRAFLEKGSRFDDRKFYESRKFNYSFGVLNSYEYSAIGSLGLNKILLVLKEIGKNMSDKPKINIIIDNLKIINQIKKFLIL